MSKFFSPLSSKTSTPVISDNAVGTPTPSSPPQPSNAVNNPTAEIVATLSDCPSEAPPSTDPPPIEPEIVTLSACPSEVPHPTEPIAFPFIQPLYKLALLIPQSTAVVERGFSLMNGIATVHRTMLQSTLDALMRISHHTANYALTEQDYESIVDLFKAAKPRANYNYQNDRNSDLCAVCAVVNC